MESDRARVLLIEDEVVLRTTLADLLHRSGLTVRSDCDGTNLLSTVADFRPDLLILDIMLPGESGFTLARRVRERSDTSILFLTARDAVADRLTGFDIGADDYLVKPFVQAELLARVRAVLRRSGRLRSGTLQVADLLVDEDAAEATRGGRPLALTATEFRVLAYLARNRGRVLSKTQILTQVWGYDAYDPNLVETYISTLRRKIETPGARLIHTVRGVGYRLSEPAGVRP